MKNLLKFKTQKFVRKISMQTGRKNNFFKKKQSHKNN
jgi:hypothetical protein